MNLRVHAGRRAFYGLGKCWYSNVPEDVVKLGFQAVVDGNYFAGLIARDIGEQEEKLWSRTELPF